MSKIKVLVTGSSGLVGSQFVELSKNYLVTTPDSKALDLTDTGSIKQVIDQHQPDWVINFAAFTDVNAAEQQRGDESGLAWKVNVDGVQNLLSVFGSKNFIQISTDMVFPGTLKHPGPYSETDTPPNSHDQLTWYGWTKNRAEKHVLQYGGTVLRIIYPVRAKFDKKPDYIRGPLKRYVEGKMYPLFRDQQICVSFIHEVVDTLNKIIDTSARGVYHCASDTTTPYDLLTFVINELGGDSTSVSSTSIHDFLKTQTNPNRYPVWGGLKTKNTEDQLDIRFSTWQTVIEHLIGQGLTLP